MMSFRRAAGPEAGWPPGRGYLTAPANPQPAARQRPPGRRTVFPAAGRRRPALFSLYRAATCRLGVSSSGIGRPARKLPGNSGHPALLTRRVCISV